MRDNEKEKQRKIERGDEEREGGRERGVVLKIIKAPVESHLPAVCIERRRESVCEI
jgi:hypothetical protein